MGLLTGKTALVCGASKGIGRATAIELATQGARIYALARTQETLEALVKELPGKGHIAIAADASQISDLKQKVQAALRDHGAAEILLCNSGGPKGGPIAAAAEEEFESAFRNHLIANHVLMQILLPGMKAAKYGRIINVLSTSVKTPLPNLGVSNTIRAAVASWAKTLAGELAAFGITVNNVLPGYIDTDRLHELVSANAQRQGKKSEDVLKQWRDSVPAGRLGQPEELAAAIAFLASPSANYVNGINLPVDGGRTPSL